MMRTPKSAARFCDIIIGRFNYFVIMLSDLINDTFVLRIHNYRFFIQHQCVCAKSFGLFNGYINKIPPFERVG